MHPAKVDRARLHALTDLPNVGPATAGDLRLLGIHAPADLAGRARTLRPAGSDDAARAAAEALSLGNMRGYLAARGVSWDPARFAESWRSYENLAIHVDGHAAGLLRLLPEDDGAALGLRDLQLRPSFQRQGHGAWAVGEALRLAAARGMARVQLRVYAENPARALYARLGFAETGYDPATRTAHLCRATA